MTDPASENVTRKSKQKMTIIVILAVVALFFGVIALQIDDWSRDWTQNAASLNDDAAREELRPKRYAIQADALADRVKSFAESNSAWQCVSTESGAPDSEEDADHADSPIVIRLTRTSTLFRFVDDVTVTIRKVADGGTVLYATSQSRIGKGDLGQNPRNLIELVHGLGDP